MEWFSSEPDLRRPGKDHLSLWKYIGLIPPKSPGFKRSLYILTSVTMHMLFTICCPLSMIINTVISETFSKFCESAFLAITTTGVSAKFASTFFIIPRLNRVSELSDRLLSRATSDDELDCLKEAMREGYVMIRRITNTFAAGLFVTELGMLVNIFSTESKLNTPAWFPVDWQHDRKMFQLCNFYQILGIFVQGVLVISSDTYVLVYIQYFIGHVNTLIVRVQKIGEQKGRNDNHDNFEELIECIRDHQQILKIFDFIQSIVNGSIFVQFISTSASQIAFGYFASLSIRSTSNVDLMGYIGQIVCITLEIGLPCYYGERVRTSYEDLAQAIYKLKWYEQDIRFQRVFILFLKRAQKDTCLMAGGYIPITLRSFLGVQRFVYSFIAMLQNTM